MYVTERASSIWIPTQIGRVNVKRLEAYGSDFLGLYGQVNKCMWWMPWQSEAMKDVAVCEKLRGVDKRTLIRRCPNGEKKSTEIPLVAASERGLALKH